jgi:Flp pilus assembly pilin Flp
MIKFKKWLKHFWRDQEGIGTLEILLIIAVIVIIAIIFRNKIVGWVKSLTDSADQQMIDFGKVPTSSTTP